MSSITYLTQQDAAAVDADLMGELGFSIDQLMELAGLSVASAVAAEYPPQLSPVTGLVSSTPPAGLSPLLSPSASPLEPSKRRVLVLAGPGNNGGDGLVAARHLVHFGYSVQVCYPKPTDKPLYQGLVTQCRSLAVPFVEWNDIKAHPMSQRYDLILDAIFGFSFKGELRPPFDDIIKVLAAEAKSTPVVSVDIPSGWDVEEGDVKGSGLQPEMLVSLTTPKLAAKKFTGKHHYVGGRFVPPAIVAKYHLQLPTYHGAEQIVKLPSSSSDRSASTTAAAEQDKAAQGVVVAVSDMRISYERGGLVEAEMLADPLKQWDAWFKKAVADKVCEEPNAVSLASVDPEGRPSVRVVLLKGYDERGFTVFTNYESRKGRELLASGHAAFTVYWEKLQQSVRVEGTVEKLPEAESDAYFHSRPRGSQIGAWVSQQSRPLQDGRDELDQRQDALSAQYADQAVPLPRPAHWGGLLIRPLAVEFWQGRPSRLHDRLKYSRADVNDSAWQMTRLQP